MAIPPPSELHRVLSTYGRSLTALDGEGDDQLFNDLFVLWRFGYPFTKQPCLEAGFRLADGADASVLIRLGLLLQDEDPDAARRCFDRAVSLGAVLPKQAEAAHPSGDVDGEPTYRRTVKQPERRAFSTPRGDGWHPAFDLAATEVPSLGFWDIPNGVLSVDQTGPQPRFYVFDADRRLIPQLSSPGVPFIAEVERHEGPIAVLDDWFSSFNVCHFLFDKWPRLEIYQSELGQDGFTPLLFAANAYYRDALKLSGYPALISPGGAQRWSVSGARLAMLSNHRRGEIVHPALSGAPWASRFLRRHAQSHHLGTRRIYVSRDDAASRRAVNDAEVQALMQAHGFDVVGLAGMTFDEQKRLFLSASHIVGVHGAGLANMAFAGRGARILEIMPPIAGMLAYWVMAQALGQSYWMFRADDAALQLWPGASFDPSLGGRPLRVDVDRLGRMLEEFLA